MSLPFEPLTDAEGQEMLALVYRLRGESFNPADEARLEELVCNRSDGRWLYVRAVDLVAGLHWCFTSNAEVIDDLTDIMFAEDQPGGSEEPVRVDAGSKPAPSRDSLINRTLTPLTKFPGIAGVVGRVNRLAGRSSLVSMLLVAVAFYGTFGLLAWNLRPGFLRTYFGIESGNQLVISPTPNHATTTAPGDEDTAPIARLTAVQDAVWQLAPGELAPQAGAALSAAQELNLTSGKAQLTFSDGARVSLEAPCRFEIQKLGRASLQAGRLVALVPPSAVGFTIATPTADVVDLGTEFAVEVDESGCANLSVLVGEVEVQPIEARKVVMKAGESGRIDSRGISALSVADKKPAAPGGLAEDINLSVDGNFDLNWNMAEVWSNERVPLPNGHYHVGLNDAKRVRTSTDSSANRFAGGALTIHKSGELAIKYPRTSRVADLRLDGGSLYLWEAHYGVSDMALAGNLRVESPSAVVLNGCRFSLRTRLSGTGEMSITGPGRLVLETDSSDFHGNWQVKDARLVAATFGALGDGNISVTGKGVLDVQYALNCPGATLTLDAGSSLVLARSVTLGHVRIAGREMPAGRYTLADLQALDEETFTGTKGELIVVGDASSQKPESIKQQP